MSNSLFSLRSFFFVSFSLFLISLFSASPVSSQAGHLYASSLTFQVEPRDERCFFEQLSRGSVLRFDFEVIRGGLLDIRFKLTDPQGNPIVDRLAFFNKNDDSLNEAEGRVEYTAQMDGEHRICYDNTMSKWTAKVVSFYVINEAGKNAAHEELAKLEHLGPTVDSVIKIADELDSIETLQHHIRVREQSHRDMVETTNSRVQWLAFTEAILLILMTLAQIHFIHQWFKDTKPRGTV